MKVAGKILLIVSGVLFLLGAAHSVIGLTNTLLAAAKSGTILANEQLISVIIGFVTAAIEFFAGLGGIFRAIGKGPFRGWVPPFAIVLFVLFAVDLVSSIINRGPIDWILYTSTAVDVAYFLGWLFTRKKR